MTKNQKDRYQNPEELKNFLDGLKGRKFRLDCGHHVTFGYHLANDITIINGSRFKVICSLCGH
jgi:hypothetical protein